ncbi:hypothetical protein [Poseidonocella sp. HB161398]|uniref:hypothetical protein n=1 Tax=Poseidonocella sp. HB161398 TaxID=2320855 RepID=UPI00148700D8|nr:hypothetical protein [Poseidonocella sp. HB161398]
MQPNLALSLSTDEVVLYAGLPEGWQRLGRVAIAERNLGLQMSVLRRIAQSHCGPAPYDTLLCVPADQVLWTRFDQDGVGGSPAEIDAHIRRCLADATPYPLEALRFDWRRSGAGIDVAVIAQETLEEVEEFISGHGFRPAGIAALAEPGAGFEGTAWFGLAGAPAVPDGREVIAAPHAGNAIALDSALPAAPAEMAAPQAPPRAPAAPAPAPRRSAAATAARHGRKLAGYILPGLLTAGLCTALAMAAFYLPDGGMPDAELAALTAPAANDAAFAADDGLELDGEEPGSEAEALLFDTAPAEPDAAAAADAALSGDPLPVEAAPGSGDGLEGSFVAVAPVSIARLGGWSADDLAQPSVDIVAQRDALALNQQEVEPARILPVAMTPPPRPDQDRSQTDAAGFVRPSAAGNPAPGGYLVKTGTPPRLPLARPAPDPADELVTRLADAGTASPGERPRKRPGNLPEQVERQQLGGLTSNELSRLRPRPRSGDAAAVAVAIFAARNPVPLPAVPEMPALTASDDTARPAPRPGNLQDRAHAAQVAMARDAAQAAAAASTAAVLTRPAAAAAPAPTKTAAPAVRAPDTVPAQAPGNVARRATDDNEMNLRRVNLLGTFGKPGALRALVRMPNGNVVNVSVGDRLDGGKVVAIAEGQLRYQRKGRNEVLNMPSG